MAIYALTTASLDSPPQTDRGDISTKENYSSKSSKVSSEGTILFSIDFILKHVIFSSQTL